MIDMNSLIQQFVIIASAGGILIGLVRVWRNSKISDILKIKFESIEFRLNTQEGDIKYLKVKSGEFESKFAEFLVMKRDVNAILAELGEIKENESRLNDKIADATKLLSQVNGSLVQMVGRVESYEGLNRLILDRNVDCGS